MGKIYSYNSESIELPDLDVDVIALSLSGGADSALLAFLIAKDIVESNSKTKILPFTRYRPWPEEAPRNWNVTRAKDVIQKIVEILETNVFLDLHVEYPQIQRMMTVAEEREHVKDLHKKLVDFTKNQGYKSCKFYYGVTSNPSKEVMIENDFLYDYRIKDRDVKNRQKRDTRPFDLVDKKFIAEIYKLENLLDTLFPITYSCEGDHNSTKNYSVHCETCWWCKERLWAFGRLI